MNKFCKKVGIIFVMTFTIMLGCLNNVLASSGAQSIKIDNTTLNFDKIIYVDATNGNDTIGTGTEKFPYSTINKAVTDCSNTNSAIFLKGSSKEDIDLQNKNITIIGDYLKYGSQTNGTIQKGSINIYDTYLSRSATGRWYEIFAYIGNLNLYNCIFDEHSSDSNVYVTSANYFNCTIINQGSIYNKINFVNCAFKTSASTNNNCLNNITYDNKFNITSDGWKNKGAGTNPDGSVANIGVYGGDFAWGYIDTTVYVSGITINKSIDNLQVGQIDTLTAIITPDNAANKNITWTSSDPVIATVDSTGKVTAIKEGTATITAKTQDGSNLSASCTVNVIAPVTTSSGIVLNIEPEKTKIKKTETVSANLIIDNIKDIAAEDVRIKYDNTKLQFVSMDEVDGIKLVKSDTQPGELRVIVASKGASNIVNAKKALLKLNFKGIATGDALVNISKGRISDGITMERDLQASECGQATITIEDLKDVNNSGEFTLLDLAIDARHLGEDSKTLPQYNTDIVANNAIDNDDLLKIGEYMLANPNYKF